MADIWSMSLHRYKLVSHTSMTWYIMWYEHDTIHDVSHNLNSDRDQNATISLVWGRNYPKGKYNLLFFFCSHVAYNHSCSYYQHRTVFATSLHTSPWLLHLCRAQKLTVCLTVTSLCPAMPPCIQESFTKKRYRCTGGRGEVQWFFPAAALRRLWLMPPHALS